MEISRSAKYLNYKALGMYIRISYTSQKKKKGITSSLDLFYSKKKKKKISLLVFSQKKRKERGLFNKENVILF